MKTTLLLAVAAAGILALVNSANAGSPRGDAMADSLKKVPGTTQDVIDRSVNSGSPKAIALAGSMRKVPSTGPIIDVAHAPRPTLSPKDPRYEVALRDNAARQLEIQVAPLK